MEIPDHDRAQHARQRRFLIIISIVLLAKYALAIEWGDRISLLGMDFEVKRKELLLVAGWGIWLWGVIRLCQYHRSVAKEEIASALLYETHWVAWKYLVRKAQRQIDAGMSHDGKPLKGKVFDVRFRKVSERAVPPGSYMDRWATYSVTEEGGRRYYEVEVAVRVHGGGETGFNIDGLVSAREMKRARFWAWLRCLVRGHVFSDYYAPFVIAAMPLVAAAIQYIGSIQWIQTSAL